MAGILGIERAIGWTAGIVRSYFNAECALVQADAGDGLTLDTADSVRDIVEYATAVETWPFEGNLLIEVYGNGSIALADGAVFTDIPRLRMQHEIVVRISLAARTGEAAEVIRRRSDRASTAILRLFLVKYREDLAANGIEWVGLMETSNRNVEGDKLTRQTTVRLEVRTSESLV